MNQRHAWERWLPVAFAVLSFVVVAPLFRHPFNFAFKSDWRHFQAAVEVARRSVVWWHQLPLWNPYACGGEVLWANPQSEVAAPTFLFAIAFGTALGVKLAVAFYIFCAFDGMYRLARALDVDALAALLASFAFGTSGWIALHLLVGHTPFLSVGLFPYLVLFYRRGLTDAYWSIALGAVAAWILALGGSATPAIAVVLLATVASTDAIARRSLLPYRVLALGVVVTVLIGAVRFFPALEFAIDHPRRKWETDASSLMDIIVAAFRWAGDVPTQGKRYRFHEYGWRISYLLPPLVLWAIWLRKARPFWVLAIVAATIVAGAAIPYGPWWLLKHLPLFRDLRVPSRYAILLAFAFAILAALALDELLARFRDARWSRAAAAVLVALVLVDGTLFFWSRLGDIPFPRATLAHREAPFFQVEGHWSVMLEEVLQNHGVLACDEEAPLQRAEALELDSAPQVRLLDPDAGTIEGYRWTANRIRIDTTLRRATTILVNENWNEHWKTTEGELVKAGNKYAADEDGGQLGVRLAAGAHATVLYYRPRSFVAGAVVSALSTLAIGLLLYRRRRRA